MFNKVDKGYFTKKLLLWNGKENDRPMPWKGEKDPYKIWLSEIILQQTRVEQGWAYYNRFVATFSDVKKSLTFLKPIMPSGLNLSPICQ